MVANPEIFFSYAWDNNATVESNEKLVNLLYHALIKDRYAVVRDKYDLEYRGFISDFMTRIGKGKCIIVAISKKYLRSPYCMFELYEIARYSNFEKTTFRDVIIPVTVEFVDFTDPAVIEEHFSYWENEYNKWTELVKTRAGQLSAGQLGRYDKIKMIYQNFGRLVEWLVDINSLNPQLLSAGNFKEVKTAIDHILSKQQPVSPGMVKKVPGNKILFSVITLVVAGVIFFLWQNQREERSAERAYEVLQPAAEQLLIIRNYDNKLFGYARSKDSSIFISCKFEEAYAFKNGIALVKYRSKFSWIKPDSSDAGYGAYDYASEFNKGAATVANNKDTFRIPLDAPAHSAPPIDLSKTTKQSKENVNQNTKAGNPVVEATEKIQPETKAPPCKAHCDTKGIAGVEVSFVDQKADTTYTFLSNDRTLNFSVPCYLLEQSVKVTFLKNGQSDYRNVQLNSFEIPDLFRN